MCKSRRNAQTRNIKGIHNRDVDSWIDVRFSCQLHQYFTRLVSHLSTSGKLYCWCVRKFENSIIASQEICLSHKANQIINLILTLSFHNIILFLQNTAISNYSSLYLYFREGGKNVLSLLVERLRSRQRHDKGFTFYQNFLNRFIDMLLLLLLLVLMLWLVCRSHSRTVSVCQATILRGTAVQCTVLPRPLLYSIVHTKHCTVLIIFIMYLWFSCCKIADWKNWIKIKLWKIDRDA